MTGLIQRPILARLHELMAALDRRRPQDRHGEAAIARAAAALRTEAAARVEALERDADMYRRAEDEGARR